MELNIERDWQAQALLLSGSGQLASCNREKRASLTASRHGGFSEELQRTLVQESLQEAREAWTITSSE